MFFCLIEGPNIPRIYKTKLFVNFQKIYITLKRDNISFLFAAFKAVKGKIIYCNRFWESGCLGLQIRYKEYGFKIPFAYLTRQATVFV
jgi:hypothetical protein